MQKMNFTGTHGRILLPLLLGFVLSNAGCDDSSTPHGSSAGNGGAETQGGAGGHGGSMNGSGGIGAAGGMGGFGGIGASSGMGGSAGIGGAGGMGGSVSGKCGNGVLDENEMCDDGNTAAGDYCAADCLAITGSCGDGLLQTNEMCDDGTITTGCNNTHDGGDGKCVPLGMCSSGYIEIPGAGCVPELLTAHVHINVSNTCVMSVMPLEYTVPAGQRLKLSYHNHSQDYPITVWMMYGGGFTDLPPGGTWNEQYTHCFGPAPSEGYADISTGCSMFRLKIHCL